MGELIASHTEVFEAKRRANQQMRSSNAINEIRGPSGNSEQYGAMLEDYTTLYDRTAKQLYFTKAECIRYEHLSITLESVFGAQMMDVLRTWNESEPRRKGQKGSRIV